MTGRNSLTSFGFCALLTALQLCASTAIAQPYATGEGVTLHDIIRTQTPQIGGGADALILSLDGPDTAQYAPDFNGRVRHAEGNAVPLGNSVGLDAQTLSLELRQPLYRSGQTRAQTQVADSRLRAAEAQKLDEVQSRNLLTTLSYIDALLADERLQLAQSMNLPAQPFQHQSSLARKALADVAHIDSHSRLSALGSPTGLPTSLQTALSIAEEKHPAVMRAHYECAAAEASSRSLNWDDAPDIDLRGGLNRTTDIYADTSNQDSGIIGLRATIPLRGEAERKTMIVQAREDAEDSRLKIDAARMEVRQKVISAWDALTTARADHRFQLRKAELAQLAVDGRLPSDSKLGALGNNDTFMRLANEARLAAVDAQYAILKAEYSLLAAMGQLTPALLAPATQAPLRQAGAFDLQNADNPADLAVTNQ